MQVVYLIVYGATMTHPHQWTITELRLKKEFINIFFFDKFINSVTLDKAFILLFFILNPLAFIVNYFYH